jgi:hypothetical protein
VKVSGTKCHSTSETVICIGKCALCRRDGQELQVSHFLSAGVYRVARDETQRNPDPLKFNDHGIFQDSKQITDYLLCWDCEQRLNYGENWFLAHCCRKNQFRLAAALDSTIPAGIYPRLKIYRAAEIPKLNVKALSYFAAGMFWRAAAHQWKMAGSECKGIELGPYEEELRKFLMDEAAFPQDCVLWITLPETVTPIVNLSLTPYGGRKTTFHVYKLLVLGVGFHLLVGRQIPRELREMCFVRGIGNPIHRTDMLEQAITQDIHYKFSLHPQLLEWPKDVHGCTSSAPDTALHASPNIPRYARGASQCRPQTSLHRLPRPWQTLRGSLSLKLQ